MWVNELGGVTFEVDGGREYVKVTPPRWAQCLEAETERLRWAAAYVRVPRVLGAGSGWLHTAGLAGSSAVVPPWVGDPRAAARAVGAGLRLLHDALPVGDCAFGPPAWVGDQPCIDRLVVCHGDACAPNTLIDDDGHCSGHVDLGTSASPIVGPIWRSRSGRCGTTTGATGVTSSLTPTASHPTRSA